jgi:hypothetical protein
MMHPIQDARKLCPFTITGGIRPVYTIHDAPHALGTVRGIQEVTPTAEVSVASERSGVFAVYAPLQEGDA